ncbi:MAG TPA: type II secretion system major pseudopilin GspG [Crenalkalicoccus sp.]|nr:type II secretion system major pseudopilin GspG [Crenalkalicoccus sp.]
MMTLRQILRRPVTRRQAGFTLLELLVVLTILGLLGAIAVPQVLRYLGTSRSQTARVQIQALMSALDLYRLDVGRYPTEEEGLRALVDRPATAAGWNGPYLSRRNGLTDPWGAAYLYRAPGRNGPVDVYALGSDRAEGGSGEAQDVGSWQ